MEDRRSESDRYSVAVRACVSICLKVEILLCRRNSSTENMLSNKISDVR